jgi:hypothetical protein
MWNIRKKTTKSYLPMQQLRMDVTPERQGLDYSVQWMIGTSNAPLKLSDANYVRGSGDVFGI